MPIDHFGVGVPDVEVAKTYYDELMPMVGYQPCFGNGYCPEDWDGAQLFLYEAGNPGDFSHRRSGYHHIAFLVPTRAVVDEVAEWVMDRGDQILHEPRVFPEYGPDCYATYFLDPHGLKIEVVCQTSERTNTPVTQPD
jgi:catechol 2,3-dioxygenase-like lactoylglutathione lyase family enzyme